MRHNIGNVIPGWNDPKQRQRILSQVDQYVQTMGFKPEEFRNMNDPRIINIAYKAMMLDQIHTSLVGKGK